MAEVYKALKDILGNKGYQSRLISISHLTELQVEIKGLHEIGMLEDTIYQRYLKRFDYDHGSLLSKFKSILTIAVPQALSSIGFTINGNTYSAVIPPTYIYGKVLGETESLLENILAGYGFKAERALLPLKLLAVRSGLGAFGRNNICYVPEMGSFHRLMAYFTDMPCSTDSWQEVKTMERCNTCSACEKACPTGCIDIDRFLIKAENCLTNLNENTDVFPGWVKADWHNALVGCMKCQQICPENKPFIGNAAEAAFFSESETKDILRETPLDRLPDETVKKLEALDMAEYYDVLARNLKLLIK